ncbi:MAG: Gfo/Idh/MocA family oxidoreductase [Flavobacteriales bacterium]|nr:Gfo/Idh/MocA family oxidoreductase [Flavobacteriales bacterium]MCB0808677.1 Gfo/Idh/MocA family oxidoreductase [Flavobacteriales bacterium]MCB0816978.1 Gfo/Idh/MocA family oxidoreductase [Flavobacteriales bacterium]MCB9200102.1 Gfo/Idh/MocA family oxidoreductase [Flavobacteriales bacterium]HPF67490.1 Gfo/Idh/MocA family oxidoreductase [Flavobacteriales bacterium]
MSAAFGSIGVLGAGHLGRIHIQQLQELPDWHLAGFYDPDPAKVEAIRSEFGAHAFHSVEELIDACGSVDVVTPTLSHFDLASAALAAGRHVFIEKPLTETPAEARRLLELRGPQGPRVQVGHVERFNPAFLAAAPHLTGPMFIETHRLAQFNPRGTDVSVVLDLMIHDLDIVLHVVKSEVARISASGVAVVSDTPDIANARIEFANGCVANLTASRISLKNMRKSRFFQRDAYIAVDMLEKSAEIVRMGPPQDEPDPFAISIDLGQGRGHRAISFDKPEVPAINAIREELRAFGVAVSQGSAPVVPLEDGLRALETAHLVLEQVQQRA